MGIAHQNDSFYFDQEFMGVIRGDEKEKFILEINWKIDKFSSQAQKILCEVISGSSIKCAEALITGQTRFTVDLNLPCNDNGMYPLHFGAFI